MCAFLTLFGSGDKRPPISGDTDSRARDTMVKQQKQKKKKKGKERKRGGKRKVRERSKERKREKQQETTKKKVDEVNTKKA